MREARSEQTWVAHRSDLKLVARWLTETTGDAFSATALTRIDVCDYKQDRQALKALESRAVDRVLRRSE